MHGYFVICSEAGISSGTCEYSIETIPGDGQIPLVVSVNGGGLTSVADIEAGVNAGALTLLDTGAVFIGTVNPQR